MGVKTRLLKLEQWLKEELELVLAQEELLWFQKSREKWITLGDRNTKFFHTTTFIRRQRNCINRLITANGEWIEDRLIMKQMTVDYFRALFNLDRFNTISYLTLANFPYWDVEDKAVMARPFSSREVYNAMFEMSPYKALALDGFQLLFYQKL